MSLECGTDSVWQVCGVETENATAFLQWRSWLRGAGLNRRPLGDAIGLTFRWRVGLYLHLRGMLAIQSLRFPPPFRGLGSVLPYRSRDVGSTDFGE
jgi:hypothetical protein